MGGLFWELLKAFKDGKSLLKGEGIIDSWQFQYLLSE
jgi:hypothetical protein